MVQFAIFVLIVWVPITVGLFTLMSPRRATVASLVGGWLLLPSISIPLPGFPDYSKVTAATFGILIGTFLFDMPRLLAFRPRWYDTLMLVWCVSHFVAALANGDGVYDGVSLTLTALFPWCIPYFIGRIYFGDQEGLRELAIGIIVGALIYIFPCLWEIKMSPILSRQIYGVGKWMGTRLGGYRPRVFLSSGLELGTWMSSASLAAWWIWRSGSLKRLAGIPFGSILLPALLITNILCRSSGAMALFLMGIATLWGSHRFKTKLLLIGVMLIPPVYCTVRIKGYWTGESLVNFIKDHYSEERAQSIDFRFRNENLMIERALQRSMLGWGGWGRALEIEPEKLKAAKVLKKVTPDGLWIIAFGQTGLIGLTTLTLIVLLPSILFLVRFPTRDWLDPAVAPAAVFAVILSLYMIDCLANAMLNVVYIVAMGGLIAIVPSGNRFGIRRPALVSTDDAYAALAIEAAADSTRSANENLARRYVDLARSLASQGYLNEARSSWFQALDLWNRLASAHPENPRVLSSWCDTCNDVAWFLLSQRESDDRDFAQAVAFALKATETFPERSDYWNTLGAAQYRAGDDQSAVDALHRSLLLQDDRGTAFDYFYFSLICSRLEQHDIARSWYEQGVTWIEEYASDDPQLQRLCHEAKEGLAHFEQSGAGI